MALQRHHIQGTLTLLPRPTPLPCSQFDEDNSGEISQIELERKLKKYAGVMTEQRYALRREAGGRKGAAFGAKVKLDHESGVPIPNAPTVMCFIANLTNTLNTRSFD